MRDKLIEPRALYDAQRDAAWLFVGEKLPPWNALTWPERDAIQATADELNESRREEI